MLLLGGAANPSPDMSIQLRIPRLYMTTDLQIDSLQAPSEQEPLPTETPDSSPDDHQEPTPEEKLAAAEAEAKMWKGRAEKATKKSPALSEEDVDWKIKNSARVALVQETFEKELQELESLGAKITNATRTKALENAERATLVQKPENASDNSLPSPSVDRGGNQMPRLTETDIALKVKPETVAEFKDYVEGR